jgi:phosphogluconate dehydratase
VAKLNDALKRVTDRVRVKSRKTRESYLSQMRAAATEGPHRTHVSCGNLAHAAAAC